MKKKPNENGNIPMIYSNRMVYHRDDLLHPTENYLFRLLELTVDSIAEYFLFSLHISCIQRSSAIAITFVVEIEL